MNLNFFHTVTKPETVLDIGANVGHFCRDYLQINPTAKFTVIEPNINCNQQLQQYSSRIYNTCLWSIEEEKEFFVSKSEPFSTGNSLMRENTHHFGDNNVLVSKINSTTLDKLFPTESFDLIKIDTQGSELHILQGGINLVNRCNYLLSEVSFFPYNNGGVLAKDLIEYVKSIGFNIIDIIEYHNYNFDSLGQGIIQCDILFGKN